MIVLFSRPKCPLCDKARTVLQEASISFDEIDVTGDSELEAEFGMFVPVVEVDGATIFHAGMDESELPELIKG